MSNIKNLKKAAELQQQLGAFCEQHNISLFSLLSIKDQSEQVETRALVGGNMPLNMQSVMKVLEKVVSDGNQPTNAN